MLGARSMFLGLLPGGFFLTRVVLSAACYVPPKQELRDSRSIAGPLDKDEHSSCQLPHEARDLGKRGSQACFGWELILPRRQGEGRQRKEQPPALFNNTSKGTDNILYLAASWK